MERKARKARSLVLRKETLKLLGGSELHAAVGGVRMWRPVGIADNTDPIYSWEDDTLG